MLFILWVLFALIGFSLSISFKLLILSGIMRISRRMMEEGFRIFVATTITIYRGILLRLCPFEVFHRAINSIKNYLSK